MSESPLKKQRTEAKKPGEERYFPNPWHGKSISADDMAKLAPALSKDVLASLSQLSKHLTTKCPAKAEADRHYEVYTGSGGLAYTFLRLYQQSALLAKQGDVKDKGFAEFAQSCLQHSADYIRCSLSRLKKDRDRPDYTFITGAPGVFAVAALANHVQLLSTSGIALNAKEREAIVAARDDAVNKVLRYYPADDDDDIPNELMYGRVGYLFTLQWLDRLCGGDGSLSHDFSAREVKKDAGGASSSGSGGKQETKASSSGSGDSKASAGAAGAAGESKSKSAAPATAPPLLPEKTRAEMARLASKVFTEIVERGKDYVADHYNESSKAPPLMWAWHGKKYLGGAHGVSGILYVLLAMTSKWVDDDDMRSLLFGTVDYLMTKRFPSGNYRSNDESKDKDDTLVHWCHGAPAICMLLGRASQLAALDAKTRDLAPKYLQACLDAGEVVWERGLLKKGLGICHGISGSGEVLLSLYRLTKDAKWLYRAWRFYEFSQTTQHKDQLWTQPDAPYSLFEGLSGAAWFWMDLLSPERSGFPAFDMV